MPTAALSPCRVCKMVGCAVHTAQPWASQRAQPAKRIRGGKLQRLRQQLFDREPLCRTCTHEGRVTVAVIRDHIVPLAEGGQDVDSNTQPLCQACSDRKTELESKRGRHRWGA